MLTATLGTSSASRASDLPANRIMRSATHCRITNHRSLCLALLLLAVAAAATCVLAENINDLHPTGYVTDLAGVVSPETKTRLEALCTELQQKTEAQIAV